MRSREFIALSACTMMLTALGIDIMLPVMGRLREAFGLAPDSTETAKIIGVFFMGQVAQLPFGFLSDRFGRLMILRIGFPLYIIGGIAAAFSPSLELMLVARFIAGMGASAVFMTTIAGVRDRYMGDQMAQTMSLIFTIFLFTPVLAPFLGLAILSVASWQVVFLTPSVFALIIFAWSFRLEESLQPAQRSKLNWANMTGRVKQVLGNRAFIRYLTITTLLFSALSCYVASSEHIMGEIYGRPVLFAPVFAVMGLIMALFTLANAKFTAKYGTRRMIRFLLAVYLLTASALLVITLTGGDPPHIMVFFVAIALLMALNLAIEPNSSAMAMEPMGQMAGLASALYGTIFFFAGSMIGSVMSSKMSHNVFPLVLGFFGIGLIGTVLAYTDKK